MSVVVAADHVCVCYRGVATAEATAIDEIRLSSHGRRAALVVAMQSLRRQHKKTESRQRHQLCEFLARHDFVLFWFVSCLSVDDTSPTSADAYILLWDG